MINCKINDIMLHVVPPQNGQAGFSQAGRVVDVTEESIKLSVQVDQVRIMEFNRRDGLDTSGLGSFIVRQDLNP